MRSADGQPLAFEPVHRLGHGPGGDVRRVRDVAQAGRPAPLDELQNLEAGEGEPGRDLQGVVHAMTQSVADCQQCIDDLIAGVWLHYSAISILRDMDSEVAS